MNRLTSVETIGFKDVILLNQENFLLKSNTYKLIQTLPNHHFIFNPAVKRDLHKGRPVNGMFMAVPDKLKNNISVV